MVNGLLKNCESLARAGKVKGCFEVPLGEGRLEWVGLLILHSLFFFWWGVGLLRAEHLGLN